MSKNLQNKKWFLKGMKDVLPAESARWRALEREMRKAEDFGVAKIGVCRIVNSKYFLVAQHLFAQKYLSLRIWKSEVSYHCSLTDVSWT